MCVVRWCCASSVRICKRVEEAALAGVRWGEVRETLQAKGTLTNIQKIWCVRFSQSSSSLVEGLYAKRALNTR